jgi:hypothetical protein
MSNALGAEEVMKVTRFVKVIDRPVQMLATAIHFVERLFMPKWHISMFFQRFLENEHFDEIMVDGLRSLFKHRANFILVDSNLFVPCFDGYTYCIELFLCFRKNGFYTALKFSVVMVGKLLMAGWYLPNEYSFCLM